MSDLSLYAHYTSLELRRHDHGVLEIVMNGAGANKSGLATADANMHRELADIWRDIDRDPDTRVALIRGDVAHGAVFQEARLAIFGAEDLFQSQRSNSAPDHLCSFSQLSIASTLIPDNCHALPQLSFSLLALQLQSLDGILQSFFLLLHTFHFQHFGVTETRTLHGFGVA